MLKMARLFNFLYDVDWESLVGVHFGMGVLMHIIVRFSGVNVLKTMTITMMKSTMTTMMMMTTTTIMIQYSPPHPPFLLDGVDVDAEAKKVEDDDGDFYFSPPPPNTMTVMAGVQGGGSPGEGVGGVQRRVKRLTPPLPLLCACYNK